MKTMAAGKFKDLCLRTLDEVARTKSTIVIAKRGRPARIIQGTLALTPGTRLGPYEILSALVCGFQCFGDLARDGQRFVERKP